MNVSAIIVTRGDVDLAPVLGSLPLEWEVVVWNNGRKCVGVSPPHTSRLTAPVSEASDLSVYGRYAAIEHATGDLIYVQDDDCVLPPESIQALIRTWKDTRNAGRVGKAGVLNLHSADTDSFIIANMPQPFRHDFYSDHCLVGFGAVFHRDLPGRAFERARGWHNLLLPKGMFNRTCDIVFTALTPRVLVDVPYENLPWASDDSRMWKQPEHVAERTRMLELVRQVRDA